MNDLKSLEVGGNIDILRKDGRIHKAIITDVNQVRQTVLVEWHEQGDTKGKEIEFIEIFDLNPHLKPENGNSLIPNGHSLIPNGNSLIPNGNNLIPNGNNLIPNANNVNEPRYNFPTTVPPQLIKDTSKRKIIQERLSAIHSKYSYGSYEKLNTRTSNHNVGNLTNIKNRSSITGLVPSSNRSPVNSDLKKQPRPSVVIEIEKLKKNREERRQRQAEVREEQRVLMNFYPKNSNWKFAKMISDFQATLEFKPLDGTELVNSRQIMVCVRKRPLNKKEIAKNDIDVISVPKKNLIIVHEPKNKVDLTKYLDNQNFYFDYVFNGECTNEIVYTYTAKPLIETIFEGGMATCFAYGQTGSGKTHTMGGSFSGKKQDLQNGIYVMASRDVFEFLNSPRFVQNNFIVSASFFEIYQGKVFDLLAKKARLRVLEDGKQQVQVVGLTEKVVTSPERVLALLQLGNSARASGKTSANVNSSRSHAVFQIVLRKPSTKQLHGKFSLIDLAGNERGVDTCSANRMTQIEGAEINKSLLALKECIRALGKRGSHLPFRQSKLTQVLRDSFVGEKSKICMIAMISPGMTSCEHTLNTLRYADRVKELVPNGVEETYMEDNNHRDNTQQLFAAQSLWNDLNGEIANGILQSEDTTDIQDELINDENVSNSMSESSNKESTITNILTPHQQT